jgi:hypothetical protein
MSELEQQKAEIEKRLAEAPADMPDVHPNIAEHYRAKVIRLAETLAEPESNGEAREDIRSLIGEVVITPGEKRGESHAILRGELTAILDLAAGRRRSPRPEVITNALARPRNHRYRRSRCESRGSVLLCNHPNRLSGSLVVRPLLAAGSTANIALELDGQLRSQFSLCTRNILIFGRPRPVSIRTVWRAATPCGSPRRLRRSTA